MKRFPPSIFLFFCLLYFYLVCFCSLQTLYSWHQFLLLIPSSTIHDPDILSAAVECFAEMIDLFLSIPAIAAALNARAAASNPSQLASTPAGSTPALSSNSSSLSSSTNLSHPSQSNNVTQLEPDGIVTLPDGNSILQAFGSVLFDVAFKDSSR
jgi:hypothetical protein